MFFSSPPKKTGKKRGMTLMEVILSLAILGGTMAVIGEFGRTAFQNARLARDLIQAELLAESILAKIRIGVMELEPIFDEPVLQFRTTTGTQDEIVDTHAVAEGNSNEALWYYSVEISEVEVGDYLNSDLSGFLVEAAVTVRQNIEGRQGAVCRLVRWIALEPEEEEEF